MCGVGKGRSLDSYEGSFMALAFNGGGVNVVLGLVHYGDIERFRELESGGAGYLNSNNDLFSQQEGPARLLRNCLNSFGTSKGGAESSDGMVGVVHRRSGNLPFFLSVSGLGTNCSPVPSIRILFPNQISSCYHLKWRVQKMLRTLGLRSRNVRLAVTSQALRSRTTPVMFSRSRDDMQQNDSVECQLFLALGSFVAHQVS